VTKQRIGEEWNSYRASVVPGDAGQTQIEETRRAFYAGAYALLSTIMAALSPDREPTSSDLVMMDEINAELEGFSRSVAGLSTS